MPNRAPLGSEDVRVVVAPTLTKLPDCDGAVVVTGSHGAAYCGGLALLARVRAAIFHDAGIGLDEAAVAALAMLDEWGIAAGAVSHLSARIGDTEDMLARGVLSRANKAASDLGVAAGMGCAEAARLLKAAAHHVGRAQKGEEARRLWSPEGARRAVVLIDSAALVDAEADRGAIIVTGSHGGLVGGEPSMALRADGAAAVFNDAGIGIDQAGLGRLAPLDRRGIAAVTVSAASARIGEAASTLAGIVSAANETARAWGAVDGMHARDLVMRWATRP